MHILIINFNLNGISHEDYVSNCNEIAHIFADIPGLISKTWLANESTNTYGGVYFWSSQQSLLDYQDSEVYAQILSNPVFANPIVTDFANLEGPSAITGGA